MKLSFCKSNLRGLFIMPDYLIIPFVCSIVIFMFSILCLSEYKHKRKIVYKAGLEYDSIFRTIVITVAVYYICHHSGGRSYGISFLEIYFFICLSISMIENCVFTTEGIGYTNILGLFIRFRFIPYENIKSIKWENYVLTFEYTSKHNKIRKGKFVVYSSKNHNKIDEILSKYLP